jgi:energy-coupling factor transporter ATP-binding protein EcfA2
LKIEKIEVSNFKFHSHLEFEIKKNNCLIYGENGTGKSSIFEALYSVFKIYYRNQNFDFIKFKKNNSEANQEIKVTFDNAKELKIPNLSYDLSENISKTRKTIYFVNQELLNIIMHDEENFHQVINKNLSKYFDNLKNILIKYNNINDLVNAQNVTEQSENKLQIDAEYKRILNQVEIRTNDIIKNHFKENFDVKLIFYNGEINNDIKFNNPLITLKINEENNLKLNFNEAKLKLTSIAIFFAFIKIEEDETNNFKLLVLDDFLTSLDMANRHYIMEYIFKEFENYQKIILTHNLQFNNLILNYINYRKCNNKWDVKNIYITKDTHGVEKASIYDKTNDYIKKAEEELINNNLATAGNLLRKEFERLVHELEKIYQIGRREESSVILDLILNNKPVFNLPHSLLAKIEANLPSIQGLIHNYDGNKEAVTTSITAIYNDIVSAKGIHYEVKLSELLKNLTFYKTILMNKGSHNNPEDETYHKEYENALEIVKELKEYIEGL